MHQVLRKGKEKEEKGVSGWLSTADCVDFYADDFGWEVNRSFHISSVFFCCSSLIHPHCTP
jgi:hypothetical protein